MDGYSRDLIRLLMRLSIGIAALMSPIHAWTQADYAREQRWADEIVPAIVVGDALRLELKSGRKVLAIYTPAPKAAAGVVVVHGLGVQSGLGLDWHAAQPAAGLRLRHAVGADARARGGRARRRLSGALPGSGRAAGRRRGAISTARDSRRWRSCRHSMGARMSNYFLTHVPGARVAAWVAIGLPTFVMEPASVRIPVLDLHGEKDSAAVLGNAAARAAVLRTIRGSAQVAGRRSRPLLRRPRGRAHAAGEALPRQAAALRAAERRRRGVNRLQCSRSVLPLAPAPAARAAATGAPGPAPCARLGGR